MDASTNPLSGGFRRRMASGVVALIPIVVTVTVLRFLFNVTSSIFLPVIEPAAASWPPLAEAMVSLGILLLIVYLLGALAQNIVGRRILLIGESLVLRVPLVKVIYSASKQVATAFQGRGSRAFKSVVFIEFPRPGMRAVGFVTGEMEDASGATWNTVFLPSTPNPTTGYLQVVPTADVIRTDYSVEDGIKMVMSLGALVPEDRPPRLS